MSEERPDPQKADEPAQVLPFRQRLRAGGKPDAAKSDAGERELVDDLARYEDEDANVDYRHRMLMNVIAVAIVTLLVGFGVWIADTIADMQRDQDCLMQGRQNCAPIEAPRGRQ